MRDNNSVQSDAFHQQEHFESFLLSVNICLVLELKKKFTHILRDAIVFNSQPEGTYLTPRSRNTSVHATDACDPSQPSCKPVSRQPVYPPSTYACSTHLGRSRAGHGADCAQMWIGVHQGGKFARLHATFMIIFSRGTVFQAVSWCAWLPNELW